MPYVLEILNVFKVLKALNVLKVLKVLKVLQGTWITWGSIAIEIGGNDRNCHTTVSKFHLAHPGCRQRKGGPTYPKWYWNQHIGSRKKISSHSPQFQGFLWVADLSRWVPGVISQLCGFGFLMNIVQFCQTSGFVSFCFMKKPEFSCLVFLQ